MNQYTRSNSTFKTKYYTALRSENKDIKNFKYEDEINDKIEFDHKLEFIEKKLKIYTNMINYYLRLITNQVKA